MNILRRFAGALLLVHGAGVHAVAASDAGVEIELNKLESRSQACRVYLVVRNAGEQRFASFKLDLVMFAKDGVIAERVAVQLAPLRPQKTGVKLFDVAGLACGDIGRVLINDVLECTTDAGPRDDCVGLVAASSRTDVELVD